MNDTLNEMLKKPRAAERYRQITSILASGKHVRMRLTPDAWKDLNDATVDQDGDMKAFRIHNCSAHFLAWENPMYEIEAIEVDN